MGRTKPQKPKEILKRKEAKNTTNHINHNYYKSFIEKSKQKGELVERRFANANYNNLNNEQKFVYDIVEKSICQKLLPLHLILPGRSGSGKSFCIKALQNLFKVHKIRSEVFSFTGSSAFMIGGRTFHRGFFFGYNYRKSSPRHCGNSLEKNLKNVKFFIFDEMSLIGLSLFGFINERLKAIYKTEEVLGGKSVILAGDFAQLPPVMDKPIYVTPDQLSALETSGAQAYASFGKVVMLKTLIRQSENEELVFRELLDRIRHGKITNEDCTLLQSRYAKNLSSEELIKFTEEATFLFAERKAVEYYNEARLKRLGNPIFEVKAKDSRNAPVGVQHVLRFAIGARIIITRNLWIEAGIYNGSTGIITEISCQVDKDGFPTYVIVKLDKYYGPLLRGIPGEVSLIPIQYPEFDKSTKISWQRTQFPFQLSFGLTVHKSQGSTLKKVVICFPKYPLKDSIFFRLCPSIFYVAISRAKRFSDVCFNQIFREDLVNSESNQGLLRMLNEEERLSRIEQSTLEQFGS